jgi:hypothetical protein
MHKVMTAKYNIIYSTSQFLSTYTGTPIQNQEGADAFKMWGKCNLYTAVLTYEPACQRIRSVVEAIVQT